MTEAGPSSSKVWSQPSSLFPPPRAPETLLYAVHFPLSHPTFRIPVLKSVAAAHDIPITFYPLPSDSKGKAKQDPHSFSHDDLVHLHDVTYDPEASSETSRPFAIVSLPSDEAAQTLLSRCTIVRNVVQLWSAGTTHQGLLNALRHASSSAHWEPLRARELSWKADVSVVGSKLSPEQKRQIIESTSFLDFLGDIKLKDPDFEWVWYEERDAVGQGDEAKSESLRLVIAGRKITLSDSHMYARDWINKLDLKKRSYIGNTSMESEMSLAMANMAQAGPGKITYDPFVGTGSLLIAAAAMGSYVMGSDIDGRMIRGKKAQGNSTAETGIVTAAKQYGLRDKFLDCFTFDITQHPWRIADWQHRGGGFFDAVVADPPYGVRAGAKRLGQRDARRAKTEPIWLEERQGWSHEQEDYVPPTRPYALNDLLRDLLTFAGKIVKDGGRLSFWMPVMNEDEEEDSETAQSHTEVPSSPEWDLIAVSTQDFGRWARRLVTLQRVSRSAVTPTTEMNANAEASTKVSASVSSSSSSSSSTVVMNGQATDGTSALGFSDSHTQFHAASGRYRANVDRSDFRNKYYGPSA